MKIYIINLKRSKERRKLMETQMENCPFSYEFIDAIDGRKFNDNEFAKHVDYQKHLIAPYYLSKTAVACTISHQFVYDKMLTDGIEIGLVLEDDVILKVDFFNLVGELLDKVKDDEIILLYYLSWKPLRMIKKSFRKLNNFYGLFEIYEGESPMAGNAYLLNCKTGQKLKEINYPVKVASDSWEFFRQQKILKKINAIYPYLISLSYQKSDIDYVNNKWIKYFADKVEKFKIPILSKLLKKRREKLSLELSKTEFI